MKILLSGSTSLTSLLGQAQETHQTIRDVPLDRFQELLRETGVVLDPRALPERPRLWQLGIVPEDTAPPVFFGGLNSGNIKP